MDFRIQLQKIINIKHEISEDVKLVDDELTKINKSWCETVHPDQNYKECISNIVEGKDEGYSYLAERMGLFRQKKFILFALHEKFGNTMKNLAEKDNNLKRNASKFFKAVFAPNLVQILLRVESFTSVSTSWTEMLRPFISVCLPCLVLCNDNLDKASERYILEPF